MTRNCTVFINKIYVLFCSVPVFNYTPAESASCLNDPLTESEVRVAIRKLKTGKSPGSDGIAAEFF